MNLLQDIERRSRLTVFLACLSIVAMIGFVDYLSTPDVLFSVFYLLAVGLATWRLGRVFGFLFACLSVAVWIGGDFASGFQFRTPLIPIWNAAILLLFYGVVIWLLDNLRALQSELESKVRQRTLALTQQMEQRERLEKEILGISEREQRRIGHDIHDTLCQHLTATAIAAQVLSHKLASQSVPESADARHIVKLVEESIVMGRNFARGVQPVQVDPEGLMDAFRNLASTTTQASGIECAFSCEAPVLVEDTATATNLYRIGQEAVTNAIRHAKPGHVSITLACQGGGLLLTVEDDGAGLPEGWDQGHGLGTRIMAHRAEIIGAALTIDPSPTGGTMVCCNLPKHHEL